MPTATATVTQNGFSLKTVVIPLGLQKPSDVLSSPPPPLSSPHMSTSSTAAVRPLYTRATRAFLHRDIRLTHTLLESAFAILRPPQTSAPDAFADDRRKWDILRITVESTVYASSPSQEERAALPDLLLASLSELPHTFISKLYNRSLLLFTPADSIVSGRNAAYIPPQVLTTLVLASLKVECPDFGRVMIEDWLARRDPTLRSVDDGTENEDGYAKILELYCLHVLPKLGQWDYAFEFLEYEGELFPKNRERLRNNLKALHTQHLASLHSYSTSNEIKTSIPRPPPSPTPSSSSSSSLSTTSTHTVVPSNRVNGTLYRRSRSSSSSSCKSDATARAKPQPHDSRLPSLQRQNGHARSSPHSRSRNSRTTSSSSGSGTRQSTLPRALPIAESAATVNHRLNIYSLIKAAIRPYFTTSRLTTLFLLFVVFPAVSYLIRRRRRAARLADTVGGIGTESGSKALITNAELVRRRLGSVDSGLVGRVWSEVVRAVVDTAKMAGSGLV